MQDIKELEISIHNLFNSMLFDPKFREFVKKNENKTVEEIAMEYDIHIELFKE